MLLSVLWKYTKKKRHLQYFTENFPISPQHDDIDLTKRADRNGKSLKMSSHRSLVKSGFYHDPMSQNPKFTERDWSFNNQLKSRLSCDQQKLADRVICEASRVIDETKETTVKFKKETDFRLGERVTQISFTVEELREQKKLGEQEQEILKVLCALFLENQFSNMSLFQDTKNRIESAIHNIRSNVLVVCEKCIILREKRTGIGKK